MQEGFNNHNKITNEEIMEFMILHYKVNKNISSSNERTLFKKLKPKRLKLYYYLETNSHNQIINLLLSKINEQQNEIIDLKQNEKYLERHLHNILLTKIFEKREIEKKAIIEDKKVSDLKSDKRYVELEREIDCLQEKFKEFV